MLYGRARALSAVERLRPHGSPVEPIGNGHASVSYPQSKDCGPIEVKQMISSASMRSQAIRSRKTAAPLKELPSIDTPWPKFGYPRLKDRGPIEGIGKLICSPSRFSLSAVERPRPH